MKPAPVRLALSAKLVVPNDSGGVDVVLIPAADC